MFQNSNLKFPRGDMKSPLQARRFFPLGRLVFRRRGDTIAIRLKDAEKSGAFAYIFKLTDLSFF
jgi:hypothetical protein